MAHWYRTRFASGRAGVRSLLVADQLWSPYPLQTTPPGRNEASKVPPPLERGHVRWCKLKAEHQKNFFTVKKKDNTALLVTFLKSPIQSSGRRVTWKAIYFGKVTVSCGNNKRKPPSSLDLV